MSEIGTNGSKVSQELLFRMGLLIVTIPAAEGIECGYDADPDGVDTPGGEAAASGGAAELEGAEFELVEGIALGKEDDDQEQVNEVEMDDEEEEWRTTEDEEDF